MAGFGTAGSMLAGAAVLFVIGSGVVAFSGWPKIATQRAPSVQLLRAPVYRSPVSRRLHVVAGTMTPRYARRLTSGAAGPTRAWGPTDPPVTERPAVERVTHMVSRTVKRVRHLANAGLQRVAGSVIRGAAMRPEAAGN